MKITFLIDQVSLHGGIERVLSIKANYLSNIDSNTIYIITTEQNNKKPCYKFNADIIFKDLNINYYRNKSYFHPKNLLKIPSHISKLKKVLKNITPDIVVVCSHSTDTFFIPFIKKRIPKVKEFHFSKFIEIDKRKNSTSIIKNCFFKFAGYVEKKYDVLVVLNPDEATYFKSNNTVIIPNPLTFYPKKVSSLDKKTIISAGRIAYVKRFDILIDIWELVNNEINDWELHIYGTGEQNYMNRLQQKIDDKKLSKNVILKDATNQIKEEMLKSSLFLMTSDNECFPLVLLEAQACGLPIISFDCPHGPRNIIKHNEDGILIKKGENETFKENILSLINNQNKRIEMGSNARKNVERFSQEKIMMLWDDLFYNLIKK